MLVDEVTRDKLADTSPEDSDVELPPRKLANVAQTRRQKTVRRLETALRSFRVLKHLTQEQVDNFMRSYIIYDLDWADEKMMTETLGPDYQKRVGECLRDYYSVLNHMCALGELEKMYIPPVMDLQANIFSNQILYEESVAEELNLPENAKVFEIGCGRGRVAAHMHLLTGARVTGLNIDHDQVTSAVAFTKAHRWPNTFVRRDMNDLPLPFQDEEFDGFYQIQAFSLCKDIPKLCAELYRVLKPGARLSLLDWASLEAFNPEDPHHTDLMRRIKPLIGAVGTPTPASLAEALESAGFKVLRTNNASIDGLQSPLIERAEGYFKTVRFALRGLVRLGLLPAHLNVIFDRFARDGDAFIEADRARLITTSYHWLAEKPKDARKLSGYIASPDASEHSVQVRLQDELQTALLNSDVVKSDSPAESDRTSSKSRTNSEFDSKSPSPANTDSTSINEPLLSSDTETKAVKGETELQLGSGVGF